MVEQTITQSVEATSHKVSFEEYLELTAGHFAEWIDGEVVYLISPLVLHQRLQLYLIRLFSAFLAIYPVGELFVAPVAMKIIEGRRGREPDLFLLLSDHQNRVTPTHIEGPADLVVEIVSEESDDRDRVTKFREYETAGVREYWMIDPAFKEALCYFAGDDKKFKRLEVDPNGAIHSQVIAGFRLHVETLWADPLPEPAQVAEIIRQMVAAK